MHMHSVIHMCTHSFVRSSVRPSDRPPIHPFVLLFVYSFFCSFIHSSFRQLFVFIDNATFFLLILHSRFIVPSEACIRRVQRDHEERGYKLPLGFRISNGSFLSRRYAVPVRESGSLETVRNKTIKLKTKKKCLIAFCQNN